jgi:WD40 repeat protein
MLSTQRTTALAVLFALGVAPFGLSNQNASAADPPTPIAIAAVNHPGPVDFEKEILPILRRKCLACHNASDAESDLVLETPQTIAKGGFEGPSAVAKDSSKSLMLVLASHQKDPVMPPADNDRGARPMTPEELGLLKLWIDQGATGEVTAGGPVQWRPLPVEMNPIYAVAMSDDGANAACGRANQLFVYHLPTKRLAARLIDPALDQANASPAGAAHLDLVQSLAFHPSGDLLASGGFRNVKLWRRPKNVRTLELASGAVESLAVSADGKWAATGGADGKIKLWDLTAGKEARTLTGHKGPVRGLAFAADGQTLYSGSADKSVRGWKIADAAELGAIETPAEVNALAVVKVGEAEQVISGGADNMVRAWLPPGSPAAAAAEAKPEGEAPQEGEPAESKDEPPKPLKEFTGHGGPITSLATSPSAPHQFISGSQDGTLRHWDAGSGAQVRQMNHGGPVIAIAVRNDGQQFASASTNNTAKLWNAANGQQVAEMKGDYRNTLRIAGLNREIALAKAEVADRKKLLEESKKRVTSEEEGLKKANEAKAASEKTFNEKVEAAKKPAADKVAADKAAADAATALTAAAVAKTAAEAAVKATVDTAAKADAALKQAAAAAEKDKENKDLAAQRDAAQKALAAAQQTKTEEDKKLAAATKAHQDAERKSQAETKKAEDAAKKAREAELEMQKAETVKNASIKAAEVATTAVQKAKDAVPLAEAAIKGAEAAQTQFEADLKTATDAQGPLQKPQLSVAFSADGALLAVGGENQQIHLFETTAGQPTEVLEGHAAAVGRLAFVDAQRLLSVAADQKLFAWDTNPAWVLERQIGNVDDPKLLIDRVLSLDFSPDGALLATGSGEPSRSGQLRIWKVADGSLAREIADAHSDTVFDCRFSPDAKYLASAGADRFMKVHQVADGAFVRAFEGHSHHVLGVAWKADGKLLATSGADSVIKIWEFRTGEQQRTVQGYGKEVTNISFVGIGEEMLSASGDKTIRTHRASNGGQVRTFGGSGGFVYATDASEDGKTIIAGGQDSVLRVFNAADGQSLAAFEPPLVELAADKVSATGE